MQTESWITFALTPEQRALISTRAPDVEEDMWERGRWSDLLRDVDGNVLGWTVLLPADLADSANIVLGGAA